MDYFDRTNPKMSARPVESIFEFDILDIAESDDLSETVSHP